MTALGFTITAKRPPVNDDLFGGTPPAPATKARKSPTAPQPVPVPELVELVPVPQPELALVAFPQPVPVMVVAPPKALPNYANDDYNRDRAIDALHSIDPDNIKIESGDPWVVVSTSAKCVGITFDQWLEWTSKSRAHMGEQDARSRWKSFKIEFSSPKVLYRAARAAGWQQKPSGEYGDVFYTPPAPKPEQKKKGPPVELGYAFARTEPFSESHPYAAKKGFLSVPALSHLRQFPDNDNYHPGHLFLPLYENGQMVSATLIPPGEGMKTLFKGATAGEGFFTVGTIDPTEPVYICEGLGAAWACYQAAGTAAIAACGKGRMGTVAKAVQSLYPDTPIVLVSDAGKKTETETQKLAKRLGCAVVIMGGEWEDNEDVWDYLQVEGKEELLDLLENSKSNNDLNNAPPAPEPDYDRGEIPDARSRPKYVVFDDWYEAPNGEKLQPGVWYFTMKNVGKGENATIEEAQIRICSPLHVTSTTADAHDGSYGRMLEFKNTHGNWRKWSMPMAMTAGDGSDLRAILLGMGVDIPTSGRANFSRYLENQHPKTRLQCVAQTGWVNSKGRAFVLPSESIGPDAAGVTYQNEDREATVLYQAAGTIEGWRAGVSAMAVGNPMLALGLCVAFAGPLIMKARGENGGLHLFGDSSTGKTSVLQAGCSVWGQPEGYKRNWRGTSNGLEAAAAMFNDSFMTLDEIKQCAAKDVDETIYMLGNGQGKARATRSGGGRDVARWRCSVLSTGEMSVATKLAEGGLRIHAGQEVRLLDIHCDNRAAGGVWDTLHHYPDSRALSDGVTSEAATHYGHAGRAFLEALAASPDDFVKALAGIREGFDADGASQEQRVASRFALLALAGELATVWGITGWPEGEAIQAAAAGFETWRNFRDNHGANAERGQAARAVMEFIERHGDSRFSDADAPPNNYHPTTRDRAGYWRKDGEGGRLFLFNSVGLKEALVGRDFKRGIRWLQEAGMIQPTGGDGKSSKVSTIQGIRGRWYEVRPNAAEGTV